MQRQQALEIVRTYVKNEALVRHMFSVEAVMRAYAEQLGKDVELWGLTGLLHDFDYEQYPTIPEHPLKGADIQAERGYPDDMIYAIKTHADFLNLPRSTPMEKTLFAVDELAGLLTAAALVQPEKRIQTVQVASVKKKLKDKAFARSVNRDDIRKGAEELGVALDEHIAFCLEVMRQAADALGL